MNHHQFIKTMLMEYGMDEAKSADTPMLHKHDLDVVIEKAKRAETDKDPERNADGTEYRSLIGKLLYLSNTTRCDITQAVSKLSRYMAEPKFKHFVAAKRVLRYLKNTTNFGIRYSKQDTWSLDVFCDADWGNDPIDRKSISGYFSSLSGGALSWSSKKQHTVATSTTEAEFLALSETVKEVLWLKMLIQEMQLRLQNSPITIFNDNTQAIRLASLHGRTKHNYIRYKFVRERVNRREVFIDYVKSENRADTLNKPLQKNQFETIRDLIDIKAREV
ncbi:hypothetical protein TRVA0_009S00122 [Trichomonascus vanleenenianus]|uniref:Ty1/Copia family ribonuclease HI n=1 Tax=Trichomonascus vanleenenianus TaxID=2268995 RepID=UPI003EC9B323